MSAKIKKQKTSQPDQSRQIDFQRQMIERLQNKLDVQLSRNKILRRELESMIHGQPTPWGEWQEIQQGIFGNGQVVGYDGDHIVFVNQVYTVAIFRPDDRVVIHLSIKRNDGSAIRDWRDMQRIKNELLGPEFEAVELYPAESRLTDGANQFHLWAINGQFPFGFNARLVSENEDGGVQQRAWPEETKPADLQVITEQEMLDFAGIKPT